MAAVTISTAFSGVGCPEHASHTMACAFQSFYGVGAQPELLFTQEKLPSSNDELELLPHLRLPGQQVDLSHGPCHFEDIELFLVEGEVQQMLRANGNRMYYEDLERAVLEKNGAAVRLQGPRCRRHKRPCVLRRATVHIGGPPCVTWSKMPGDRPGTKKGTGYGALPFLVWVAQRLKLREEAFLHENVPEHGVELLDKYFAEYYVLMSCMLCSSMFGSPNYRQRRYTWAIRKDVFASRERVPGYLPWGDEFVQFFRRECACSWHMFWESATEPEIEIERQWAANRPSSMMAGEDLGDTVTCEDCLTWTEASWKDEYVRIIGGHDDAVIMLGQNAYNMPCHNGNMFNYLQTLIKNMHPLHSLSHRRWLVCREAAQVHGWSTYTSCFGETCVFNIPRETRSRIKVFQAIGNGMCLNCIGLALMWFFAFDLGRSSVRSSALFSKMVAAACKREMSQAAQSDPSKSARLS